MLESGRIYFLLTNAVIFQGTGEVQINEPKDSEGVSLFTVHPFFLGGVFVLLINGKNHLSSL